MHPEAIGRGYLVPMLDSVITGMARRGRPWFATHAQPLLRGHRSSHRGGAGPDHGAAAHSRSARRSERGWRPRQ